MIQKPTVKKYFYFYFLLLDKKIFFYLKNKREVRGNELLNIIIYV